MTEIFKGSLQAQSMELLMAVHQFDEKYKARLEGLRQQLLGISKKFEQRRAEIDKNADQYEQSKVVDLQYNLRESVKQTIKELVDSKGFQAEIDQCRVELEADDPKNDIQELTQVMKEIEIRNAMRDSGDRFAVLFQDKIMDGNPLVISAIEGSIQSFPVDPEVLESGKKRRLEVLKPALAKRFHALETAQNTLESLAETVTPYRAGDDDPISKLARGEGI